NADSETQIIKSNSISAVSLPSEKVSANKGIASVEQLAVIIRQIGEKGIDLILKYAPEKLHELIPDLETLLRLLMTIGFHKDKLIMSLGAERLTTFAKEIEFPWQLAALLNQLSSKDRAVVMDICADNLDSILLNQDEVMEFLSEINFEYRSQVLIRYGRYFSSILKAQASEEIKLSARLDEKAALPKIIAESGSLAMAVYENINLLEDQKKIGDSEFNEDVIGKRVTKLAELKDLFVSIPQYQQTQLLINSWPRVKFFIGEIKEVSDFCDFFKILGFQPRLVFLQRVLQPTEAIVLPVLAEESKGTGTALVLKSRADKSLIAKPASHASATDLGSITSLVLREAEKTKPTSSVAGFEKDVFLANRDKFIESLPAVLSYLDSPREFAVLLTLLKPEAKNEVLKQFLPAPKKKEVWDSRAFTDQEFGIYSKLSEKEKFDIRRDQKILPISSIYLYGLAVAYKNQLEGKATWSLFSSNPKLLFLTKIIHAMENEDELSKADCDKLTSHLELQQLYDRYTKNLKEGEKPFSATERSYSYNPDPTNFKPPRR
ncbi:MAG TPA: hypothetical protein VD770_02225, partial [Coxiellaceae bacterium]|nr:hypothetical protein [Coxiellaceae bacterium]